MEEENEVLTARQRLKWLSELIKSDSVSVGDKLKASEQMNKIHSQYIQKEQDRDRVQVIRIELTD